MVNTEAVHISNVSKYFIVEKTRFYALKNISLKIKKGEIFGILGPNGAGKTTLLNTLNGMLTPDQGTIKFFGKPRTQETYETMNFISGESRFLWTLNAKQILKFYAMLYNVPKTRAKKRIANLIETFEISTFANQKFQTLSTGQRMRLVLAKSLINNPKLLLLDEPTLGLDPDIAAKVRNHIKKINKKYKTTIILTSHYMLEVEQLCKRIAFMHKGQIVDIGSVEKVKLKKFEEYDVIIELAQIKNKKYLQKMGFEIERNIVTTKLSNNQNISQILSALVKNGYNIIDLEIKKPSLEDYFIKMLK